MTPIFPQAPQSSPTTALHPQDRAMDIDLPALLADRRALRDGELAEQAHLVDALDAALMTLAPHSPICCPEVAA